MAETIAARYLWYVLIGFIVFGVFAVSKLLYERRFRKLGNKVVGKVVDVTLSECTENSAVYKIAIVYTDKDGAPRKAFGTMAFPITRKETKMGFARHISVGAEIQAWVDPAKNEFIVCR